MNEELRAYLQAMEVRLTARMNDQHETILNRLASLERDFLNTKGFLVEDVVIASRRATDQETRLNRLERSRDTGQ